MRQLGISMSITLNTIGNLFTINKCAIDGQISDLALEHKINLPMVYTRQKC